MSFTAEGWAWDQVAPSSAAKAVLVCLGWYANKEGEQAFPSISTIKCRTQLAERTVRKALSELVRVGLITPHERRAGKRCLSTEYHLTMQDSPLANLPEGGLPDEAAPLADLLPPPSKSARESIQLSKEEVPSLREGGSAQAPPAETDQPDIRKQLWTEGPPLVASLTGRLNGQARSLIGRFLKSANGDCQVVLDALQAADRERPWNAVEWVQGAIRARNGSARGVLDTIRAEWGLTSFLVPPPLEDGEEADDSPAPSFLRLEGSP